VSAFADERQWTRRRTRYDTVHVLPIEVPVLEDPPVRLRPWRDSDAALVVSVASDPLIPLITTVPTEASPQNVAAYLQRQHRRLEEGSGYSFVIADGRTDEGVGSIGLWTSMIASGRASTGYWIASPFRGRRYATVALRILTTWALTIPEVERLQLYVEPWNEASWRAAEAVGYQREGLLRSWQRVGSLRKDMFIYAILPSR
jgi:RimJ/RimL family protein N-acetyltransferase